MAERRSRRDRRRAPRRRTDIGRTVYSRGPIILGLVGTTVLTGLAAVGSLIFALVGFSGKINVQEVTRQNSALDTCRLFQITFDEAISVQARQPVHNRQGKVIGYVQPGGASAKAQLVPFEKQVGIFNCQAYSRRVIEGKIVVPPPTRVLGQPPKEVHP